MKRDISPLPRLSGCRACLTSCQSQVHSLSFTYLCRTNLDDQKISPKDDEIEDARWFSKNEALEKMVSVFDAEAIRKLL